jgi:hypothetical protein
MTGAHRQRRYGRSVAVTVALVAGLAACGGDDDDAADSTSASETTGVEATGPETTAPPEITAAHDTTGTEPADTTGGSTEGTTPEGSQPEAAGPEGTASDGTEAPDGAAAAAAAEDTEAGGTTADGETDGTAIAAGPTTTGPECEFEENSALPLERCDMGPAVAVVQSILQANGFAVDTIDGNFGDQTLYAVRAFQEEEGLEVDGIVGLQTWTALDVSQFGTDEDGDGVIEPDEIDLTE